MINYKLQSVKGKDLEPGDLIFLDGCRLFAYLIIEEDDFRQEIISIPGYVKVEHQVRDRAIYKRLPKKARSEWYEHIETEAYQEAAKAAGLSDD